MREIKRTSDSAFFRPNPVVAHVFDCSKSSRRCTPNDLWDMLSLGMFSIEDLKEFYQMIGYRIGGFVELFEDHLTPEEKQQLSEIIPLD